MLRFSGWLFKLVMMVVAFKACVMAGFTNDYNKLSREQQERIHNLHSTELIASPKFYSPFPDKSLFRQLLFKCQLCSEVAGFKGFKISVAS